MNTVRILNVNIDNLSQRELLQKLGQGGGVVFTPNVDHLVRLQQDKEFYRTYQCSDYRVCDSQILYYASRLLGQPIREKISGSDLLPAFYRYYKNCENTTIFLLGAREGVAARAQRRINSMVGREMVVDSYSPPFGFEEDEVECQRIIDRINQSKATVLGIGVGSPKQEKWIVRYKHKLKHIRIFLAIGATIDFEAGEKPRSPQWMSELGVEWLYRLSSEPKRLWKRYLVDDLPFAWLLLKQWLNLYRSPDFSGVPGGSAVQMPLLGQLLQEAGLITASQVNSVLDAQAHQHDLRFGEIIASWGWLNQETVDFFAEELPKVALEPRKEPIGHYLRAAKLLNDWQVEAILAEQENQSRMRFGEIAVQKGWLKNETVDSILRYLAGDFSDVIAA